MTIRAVHVTNISEAEREAWPSIAPFCGEPRFERSDPFGRKPVVVYGVYAAHDREKALLQEWIATLRDAGEATS